MERRKLDPLLETATAANTHKGHTVMNYTEDSENSQAPSPLFTIRVHLNVVVMNGCDFNVKNKQTPKPPKTAHLQNAKSITTSELLTSFPVLLKQQMCPSTEPITTCSEKQFGEEKKGVSLQ